jgi:hypothetical protein
MTSNLIAALYTSRVIVALLLRKNNNAKTSSLYVVKMQLQLVIGVLYAKTLLQRTNILLNKLKGHILHLFVN